MKALVWSGIVQGFSTPPLMLLILLMTNNRAIMGERVNSRLTNVLGWITVVAIFGAGGARGELAAVACGAGDRRLQ
jgi:Mn2+/Fe2+ NRAMP family transporter